MNNEKEARKNYSTKNTRADAFSLEGLAVVLLVRFLQESRI